VGDQRGRAVRQWDRARAFALSFPRAFEDFPWGVPVVKVVDESYRNVAPKRLVALLDSRILDR